MLFFSFVFALLIAGADAKFLRRAPSTRLGASHNSSDSTHKCLQGKRIVVIGPSTSLADYLALSLFAEYGRWPEDRYSVQVGKHIGPNPLSMEYIGFDANSLPLEALQSPEVAGCRAATREAYCRYSNHIMNGHEKCDCFADGPWTGFNDVHKPTENRIYKNGDTMIAYFLWGGQVLHPRGNLDVPQAFRQSATAGPRQCPPGQLPDPHLFSWQQQLPAFIANVVKQAKPTHLVVSAAVWPVDGLGADFWDALGAAGVNAVSDSGGKVYWRTTPRRLGYANPADSVDLTHFRGWQTFDAKHIVDRSYPGNPDMAFIDQVHLTPAGVCAVNQAFLAENVCPQR